MRPVTRGRPVPCPCRTTDGPIGTQRWASPVGKPLGTEIPFRVRPFFGGGSASRAPTASLRAASS